MNTIEAWCREMAYRKNGLRVTVAAAALAVVESGIQSVVPIRVRHTLVGLNTSAETWYKSHSGRKLSMLQTSHAIVFI